MQQDNDKIMAGGPHLRFAALAMPDPEYNDIDPGDDITWEQNCVQSVAITGNPTGGTFTLTFTDPTDGTSQTTATIAYNAAASAVKSALEALAGIGVGDVACTGGALPGAPVVVTFEGALAGVNVAALTADGGSLTGGTAPAVAVTRSQVGYSYSEPFAFSEDTKVAFVEKSDDFRPIWSLFRTHDVVIEKGIDRIKTFMSQRATEALSLIHNAMSRSTVDADTDQVGLDVSEPDSAAASTYYRGFLIMKSAAGGFFAIEVKKFRFEGDFEQSFGHMKDKVPVTLKCFADDSGKTWGLVEQTADASA